MAPVSTPCSHVSDGELEGPRPKEAAQALPGTRLGEMYSLTPEPPWKIPGAG